MITIITINHKQLIKKQNWIKLVLTCSTNPCGKAGDVENESDSSSKTMSLLSTLSLRKNSSGAKKREKEMLDNDGNSVLQQLSSV